MCPYVIALVIYLFINKSARMLYIYSHYLMKLHDFFFFLQLAHAGIFFLVQFLAWFFFLDLTAPLPGYLMVHPLYIYHQINNLITDFSTSS